MPTPRLDRVGQQMAGRYPCRICHLLAPRHGSSHGATAVTGVTEGGHRNKVAVPTRESASLLLYGRLPITEELLAFVHHLVHNTRTGSKQFAIIVSPVQFDVSGRMRRVSTLYLGSQRTTLSRWTFILVYIDCLDSELFKSLTVLNRCTVDVLEINAILIKYWEILSLNLMKMIHKNVRNVLLKLQINNEIMRTPWLAQTTGKMKFCEFGLHLSSL